MTNQELIKELIAHGFKTTKSVDTPTYKYIGKSEKGPFEINIDLKAPSFYASMWLNNTPILSLYLNVSFEYIKTQAKELLGVELKKVKPAITWENAWEGKKTSYFIASELNNIEVIFDDIEPGDLLTFLEEGHCLKRTHAKLVQILPSLLARVALANELYPAEEGQGFECIIPLISDIGIWATHKLYAKPIGIYFVSNESYDAFIKEEKNKADLLAALELKL